MEIMKQKRLSYVLFLLFLGTAAPALLSGCSKKTGCPAYEDVHTKTNRKGELSTKRGSSNVFPREMRRKM